MTDHTSERVDIGGCAVEILRGGAGPKLLFLHGAGGASAWAPFMDRLAERFELIVPSHPGFGRSDTALRSRVPRPPTSTTHSGVGTNTGRS